MSKIGGFHGGSFPIPEGRSIQDYLPQGAKSSVMNIPLVPLNVRLEFPQISKGKATMNIKDFWDGEQFIPGYWTGKPRPSADSEEIKILAIEKNFKKIKEWQENSFEDLLEEESAKKDLIEKWDQDSFIFARELATWDCNREFIDILDDIIVDSYNIKELALNSWVNDNSPIPRFKPGHKVNVELGYRDIFEASIVSIDMEKAKYRVSVPAKSGVYVVPFEAVDRENP